MWVRVACPVLPRSVRCVVAQVALMTTVTMTPHNRASVVKRQLPNGGWSEVLLLRRDWGGKSREPDSRISIGRFDLTEQKRVMI